MNTKPPCKVLWYGEEWICRDQLQSFRFPRQFKDCFLVGCPGRGPYVEKQEPVAIEDPAVEKCAFFKCSEPRAKGRKYCSDRCRLRNARWAYKQRNKEARRARKRKKST